MTQHIYALLVGIDEYLSPVSTLRGCINDVTAMKDYLEGRIEDQHQLHIQTLFNYEATYSAIVNGFRSHLCQAKSEDVVLFYYAGHGSQEQTPEEFWAIEPDHLHETLVCYDSRTPTGKDLSDKELAKLIAEVAENNPQITIVLDCCHSGSGTRELDSTVRQTSADGRVRSLNDFLFSPKEIEQLSSVTDWAMPRGKHVLISACRDRELAKEVRVEGQNRGAFSYYLMDTLKRSNTSLTIRDLFKRTAALIASKVIAQSPQLEATVPSELDRPFLGGAIASRVDHFTASYHKDYEWIIDGGAIHGIPQPSFGETTILALFPFKTATTDLKTLPHAIAHAQVLTVLPNLSQIQIEGITAQPDQTFKAIVISLPLPPKGIVLSGDEIGLELARTQLQPSLYVQEAKTEEAVFKLIARDQCYSITRSTDDHPLVTAIQGYTFESVSKAVQRLEHMARWINIAELASPAVSRIPSDAVQMQIYQDNQELQDLDIQFTYQPQQPTFKVKLRNTSDQALYCALLDLTDRYAVDAGLFEAGGIWLDPGQEVWALGNQPIYASVPEALWKQGKTETKDILKLIVSTTEFDATLLEQFELDLPTPPHRSVERGQGTLNRLMNRVQRRELRSAPEEPVCDDWTTSQIMITTVRPQPTVSISRDQTVAIVPGVRISSHSTFSANVRLTTELSPTRDLGDRKLPLLSQQMQPFQFVPSRGNDPGLSILELTQVSDRTQVTANNPLRLLLETPLAPNEYLLPMSYDGEFFLPLGRAHRTTENQTEIILERLTEPISEGQRSLGGSIRIFFQKVVTEQLGLQFNYPLLAIADINPDETLTYTHDLQQIQTRVAQADRIVLYIHGMIGDSQTIVPSLQHANLRDRYDVILTFDYENLNTSIEETAQLLKQRLAAIGLTENHSKQLDIVAYSLGGLVSRWFIEREGGNQIVQHLLMLGTPNAGTPWSTLEDWALLTLSVGLNGLSHCTWSAPIVGMLLKAINRPMKLLESIDITLDQMHPRSEFLNTLAASPDPGIPYSIIAGDVLSISKSSQAQRDQQLNKLARLSQSLFRRVVAIPFLNQPNDIAATVWSIKKVNWKRVQFYDVDCDHLAYLSDPTALSVFSKAMIQAQVPGGVK